MPPPQVATKTFPVHNSRRRVPSYGRNLNKLQRLSSTENAPALARTASRDVMHNHGYNRSGSSDKLAALGAGTRKDSGSSLHLKEKGRKSSLAINGNHSNNYQYGDSDKGSPSQEKDEISKNMSNLNISNSQKQNKADNDDQKEDLDEKLQRVRSDVDIGRRSKSHRKGGNDTSINPTTMTRTQQKMYLQRESAMIVSPSTASSVARGSEDAESRKLERENDRINREFTNATRFRDPVVEALGRVAFLVTATKKTRASSTSTTTKQSSLDNLSLSTRSESQARGKAARFELHDEDDDHEPDSRHFSTKRNAELLRLWEVRQESKT